MDLNHHQPTEDECWAKFRVAMAGVLADMLQEGWVPEPAVA